MSIQGPYILFDKTNFACTVFQSVEEAMAESERLAKDIANYHPYTHQDLVDGHKHFLAHVVVSVTAGHVCGRDYSKP